MSERYQRGEIVNVALQDARLIAAAPEMYEALREFTGSPQARGSSPHARRVRD